MSTSRKRWSESPCMSRMATSIRSKERFPYKSVDTESSRFREAKHLAPKHGPKPGSKFQATYGPEYKIIIDNSQPDAADSSLKNDPDEQFAGAGTTAQTPRNVEPDLSHPS